MKKFIMGFIIASLVLFVFNRNLLAFIEPIDHTFDEEEGAVYIIGTSYLWLKGASQIDNTIYKINLKDQSKIAFYSGDKRRVDRLTLSPDSEYIAVVTQCQHKPGQLLIIEKKSRTIIVEINENEGLLMYKWSPDSKKIAYITGITGEFDRVLSKGIWTYDLEKRRKTKIADEAVDLEWLPSGGIYVVKKIDQSYDPTKPGGATTRFDVAIFDSQGKATKDTDLKGIQFSLDRRYSIDPRYLWSTRETDEDEKMIWIDLFDLKTEKRIRGQRLTNIFSDPSSVIWSDTFWARSNRLVIKKSILGSLTRDILICDIQNNTVLKRYKGETAGVNGNRSKIVLFNAGKFELADVP